MWLNIELSWCQLCCRWWHHRCAVFKIISETCRTEAQFWQNLYTTKKENLPDQPKFCRSGSAVQALILKTGCGPTTSMNNQFTMTNQAGSSILKEPEQQSLNHITKLSLKKVNQKWCLLNVSQAWTCRMWSVNSSCAGAGTYSEN